MHFLYLTADPSQSELDSLPRLPLTLRYGQQQIMGVGLVDNGATVNVLPYNVGAELGAVWDDHKATIRLAGNLGNFPAMPLVVTAEIGDFAPVRLAFAWTQAEAAMFFGETQPRISNLFKGEISRFSIDKIINLLARAGLEVHVETKRKAA